MLSANAPFSMLTAVLLALAVGCSARSVRGGAETTRDAASAAPASAASGAPVAATPGAEISASLAPDPAPALASGQTPRTPVAGDALPAPRAPAARNSPIQALNQLVTAQALLVSLLLAPLSKEGAEGPMARVDAAPASAPTR